MWNAHFLLPADVMYQGVGGEVEQTGKLIKERPFKVRETVVGGSWKKRGGTRLGMMAHNVGSGLK